MLEIISLIVACVAVAIGTIALVRARSADDHAKHTERSTQELFERADLLGKQVADAAERARVARQDSAAALDRATAARTEANAAHSYADEALAAAEQAVAASRENAVEESPEEQSTVVSPPAALPQAAIQWQAGRVKGATWVVTNVGAVVARAALISDATQPPKYVRPEEVIPRDVQVGDHLQFKASFGRGTPPPRVRVQWKCDGDEEQRIVEITLISE